MRKPRTRAGEMNERVEIWAKVLTTDSMGGKTEADDTKPLKTVWGKVEALQGTRGLEYAQVVGYQGSRFVIPFIDITAKNYLVNDGRTFTITSIIEVEDRQIEILAYEKK